MIGDNLRLLIALFLLGQVVIGPETWRSPWADCCNLWSLPDIDQDGDVDIDDLVLWSELAGHWPRPCAGPDDIEEGPYCCKADLNRDGWIDMMDLEILLKWFNADVYVASDYYDWACNRSP